MTGREDIHLSRQEFEDLVVEAMGGLPDEFAEKLENVQFLVENRPGPQHRLRGAKRPGALLGLYVGVPLTERSSFDVRMMPDQIIIFQRPIERICSTRAEVVDEVRRTVLHEIAHHFGIPEQRLRELGY